MGAGRESVPPDPASAAVIWHPASMDGDGESIEPIPTAEAFASPFPPPPPEPIEPPEPSRGHGSSNLVRLAVGVIAGAALIGVGAVVFGGDDGTDYPDEWDERVADLAD